MRHTPLQPSQRTSAAGSHVATVARLLLFLVCAACALGAPSARGEDAKSAPPADAATPVGANGASIGSVVIASGRVEADGAAGSRVLQKGDPVFEGDVLRTDPGGRTQITFKDGARLAVRPSTRLAIEAYHDTDGARVEQIAFRLERGGFRTVTGRIGRRNRGSYRFATPQAVIGIRGTDWGAQLVEDEDSGSRLQVGVVDGDITVSNDGGSIDLGDDADFKFATVDNFSAPPLPIAEPPAGLSDVLALPLGVPEAGADGAAAADGAQASAEDGGVEIGTDSDGPADDGVLFEYGERCF